VSAIFAWPLYGAAVLLCAVLIIDAAVGFVRSSQSANGPATPDAASGREPQAQRISVIRTEPGADSRIRRVPYYSAFAELVAQSGSPVSLRNAVIVTAAISIIAAIVFGVLMPAEMLVAAVPFGLAIGIGSVVLYFVQARAARVARFEEQLPEAIDLMIRSLKVGHPLSASIAVVARELPVPISEEFGIAADQAGYGLSIPEAMKEMAQRVPVTDLSYLQVAIQIQQEAGGNLVEPLTKLASVIRERYRMFRKVKAITAEGRISAWLLSFFPFIIAFAIKLVRPNYFASIADFPYYHQLVIAVIILLALNIVVMFSITRLKV
jgi:tight adherence protein B